MATAFQVLFGKMKTTEIPNAKEIMKFWNNISSDSTKLNSMEVG